MTYLDRAIKDGYAIITGPENKQKIIYVTSDNHTENYNDPEEKVRAEFWAELIYEYDYPAHRIKVEVTIPDRVPTDRADIVIFSDDECKKPYAVVECKRDGVTDAEFLQAIEQGVGNATWVKLRASYVVIIAGATRRVLDFSDDSTGILERENNIIADLPKAYGKPQAFRFYRGGEYTDADGKKKKAPDIQPVAREDLIAAIKKCHNTLWGGGRLSPPTAFGELCKLIFVKISDEQKPRKKGEPYQFQIKTHEPSSKLAERINALYDEQKVKDPEVFTDSIKVDDTKVKDNPLNENFAKREFQALWREINHKYAYTVDFDSAELIRNAIAHIDEKLFVSELQYTTTIGRQKTEMNEYEIERGASFTGEKTRTQTLKHAETSQIKYDLIGKIAEGTVLTRRTVSAILQGIRVDKLYMFKNNPEEFITKVIRLINEQKATMIVEHISYDTIEGEYDSSIFTAEKATQSFDKAFLAKKAIQDYVFTDGSADKSIERKFAEDLDAADEVCVYAKLPRTFQIPTPVGNYSPDWAIAFYEGKVKHIFFIAETKGTMESLELRPIEQAKISCAKKLFNEMSTSNVVYHDVDSYQSLLNIMNSL